MSLGRDDATRIIRFCLAGAGWGSAVHEDDRCVLKIALSPSSASSSPGDTVARRFEGETFEVALRQAAEAGVLKSVCLEKQIAFLARSLPERRPTALDEDAEANLVRPVASEALFSSVTAAVSALVHEIQVERGTSALYLTSGGRLFARELRAQWRSTDARHMELQSFWQRGGASTLPATVVRQLVATEPALARLVEGREQVEGLRISAATVIDSHSRVNDRLLAVIDDLATDGVAGTSRPTALAWMSLLHAKEKTGRERAQLASVFSRDSYLDGQHSTVSALIAAGQSYLHVFSAAAPRPAGEMLREKMRSDVVEAVTRMEHVALVNRDGGFGIDPQDWFSTITRKMDLLSDVESAVRASLSG